jgi:NAD(P)-dependent dehydrogenase (short-subunit alcohol dehydrogenase family)
MNDFAGRTAFITGGAQGIGLGIAQALASVGVKVAIADVNLAALDAAVAELSTITEVVGHLLDVRDRVEFSKVADHVEEELGPVSLLFNNAGLATRVKAESMSYESWDWVMGVNLGGVINGLQTFVPRMLGRPDDAYIVNTSSGSGLISGFAGYLYNGSKFAIVGLTEALREELAESNIAISTLVPGAVATGLIFNSEALKPTDFNNAADVGAGWRGEASAVMEKGVLPRDVGEMVVEAIRNDSSAFIFTDGSIAPRIRARTDMLLDAMKDQGFDVDSPMDDV